MKQYREERVKLADRLTEGRLDRQALCFRKIDIGQKMIGMVDEEMRS